MRKLSGDAAQVESQVGRVVLIIRGGELLAEVAGGPADVTAGRSVKMYTSFQISSVSKVWMATIFGILFERGALDWNKRIDRWFPTLPYGSEVSIQHLLLHTSGLGHWDAMGGPEAFAMLDDDERIEAIARTPLHAQPGRRWSYSGPGYVLLGHIASLIAGQPYSAIVEREIIAELGLTNTTCGRPTDRNSDVALGHRGRDTKPLLAFATLPGTGDIWSTAPDLATFAAALQDGKLVQPSTARTSLDTSVHVGGGVFSHTWATTVRYAYGRYIGTISDNPAWFHPGDNPGFQSFLGYIPEDRTTVVALSNADDVPISAFIEAALRDAGLV